MAFSFTRTIRFSDTDAAGVVYFANVLSICHEVYEESLTSFGIDLKSFFSYPEVAYPIVHASVDFKRPMYCGDRIVISLHPQIIDDASFEITYAIESGSEKIALAKALTRHVCINATARKKQPLTSTMIDWINSVAAN
ncbi:acyl-CoA thioesterase [Merismopedia glauca]|uniref:1,4-dihydroxy-2-naphthoyl-CoA hydrolase n=1 Tax=Merismopedia glauca CCAP 1448/3 TaxID=1296344 RepID=A0A2T1C7L3_9CYAN|nr:thioesterase family protein [Merismopedia glauca]PSB04148.1 1,4-dihydroxy-2-naphthoyl-CoA hydrolase [Merismopedia glauca CCAP 1448/3]